ncbi:unnamed protein product [Clonostachys chloroleuca]|uniref:Nuclear condensin complex subunit 3 C-terminal domain-containing protein n=1 Tax=Clonostachys chloroleuca TaxID=1926264 RepID=A0AA35Q0A0_9HYPO|nr:unnamed protein product [Clonostachys chloroleuca]
MPARTANRSGRTSANRQANTTVASRSSMASSVSPESVEILDTPDNALRPRICAIFRDAQRTTATHRKLVVNLRKIHEACCYEPESERNATPEGYDEETFNYEFIRCVLRVMPVKKSESAGDKILRFVGFFLRLAGDKDAEIAGNDEEDLSVLPDNPTTRLTSQLLEAALRLMTSKDKVVRFRSTQLVSHIISTVEAIDDGLFQNVRDTLVRRIRDKEGIVRNQAVLGLCRLAEQPGEEGQDSDGQEDQATLLNKLLEVLQNDPSADVRKTLLTNLPILTASLPYLLERARDQDPGTRRAVYARLLPALGDFRHLSLTMREKLLRWGLRDRDETVRKAAGRLFRDRWIEDCCHLPSEEGEATVVEPGQVNFEALLELLERIDVTACGGENGVALEAMRGFWEGRPDYRDAVVLDDQFWETLSAESAFLARTFNDFCRNEGDGKYEWIVDEKIPEVTKLAFYLERYLKVLGEAVKRVAENKRLREEQGLDDEEEEEAEEEETLEQEFIVEQILHICLTLDYSDEVGRRKMFTLLRQTLSVEDLPEPVTKLTIEVLQHICTPDAAGEREFCSVVLEAVADVHDTIVDDPDADDASDSFHSARSEISGDTTPTREARRRATSELSEGEAHRRAVKEMLVNMKCLHIVQCMLTHVAGNLKDNTELVAMLNNLVVPAVRSHEAPVRERGLVCLGLCALLDKSLAEENLGLFIHFFSKGHPALQITALHILTDILNVHGAQLLSASPVLLKVYLKAVKGASKSSEVQAAATIAATKLLLGRVISDEGASHDLLKVLVVAYFDPSSAHNQTVRQALNYFLPVFCYSRPENQDLMRTVALDALHALLGVREGLDDDEDIDVGEDMVSLTTIGACLVDWTDPRKCYSPDAIYDSERKNVNGDVHLDFAQDILERLRGSISREEKKLTAGLLAKLYISPGSSEDRLRETYADVSDAVENGLLTDATSRNSLYKIHVSLGKIVNALDERQATERTSRRASGTNEPSVSGEKSSVGDKSTEADESKIEEQEDEDEPEATVVASKKEPQDESLVDELLSDDDESMTVTVGR